MNKDVIVEDTNLIARPRFHGIEDAELIIPDAIDLINEVESVVRDNEVKENEAEENADWNELLQPIIGSAEEDETEDEHDIENQSEIEDPEIPEVDNSVYSGIQELKLEDAIIYIAVKNGYSIAINQNIIGELQGVNYIKLEVIDESMLVDLDLDDLDNINARHDATEVHVFPAFKDGAFVYWKDQPSAGVDVEIEPLDSTNDIDINSSAVINRSLPNGFAPPSLPSGFRKPLNVSSNIEATNAVKRYNNKKNKNRQSNKNAKKSRQKNRR